MKHIVYMIFMAWFFSQTTFQILEQPVDARSLALTNGASASPSDYFTVNPASVKTRVSAIRFSHINFPAEINHNELSFTTSWESSTIFGRIKSANYGEFKDGDNSETLKANDIVLELGYKTTVSNVISAGISGGYLQSRIADATSSGIFGNLGMQIRTLENRLGIGIALTHFGTQLDYYGETPEPLPTAIRTGIYFKPLHLPASLSFDIVNYLEEENIQLIGGIEFHPLNNLVFRISSGNYKNELFTGKFYADFFSGVAFGVGFEVGSVNIDISTQNLGVTGLVTGLSIGWKKK